MGDTLEMIWLFSTGVTYLAIVKVPIIPVVILVMVIAVARTLKGTGLRDHRPSKALVSMIAGAAMLIVWCVLAVVTWGGSGP